MHRASLHRSVRLFGAFRHEQTDRDAFYALLADDSAAQVAEYADLGGATILDIGGGPGYFATAFAQAGANYIGLDPDVGELSARGSPDDRMVRASGTALPVQTAAVDIAYSSNVLEHVDRPLVMLEEMLRVTRPGGTVFVSFTPWRSPWGGHETSPWHLLGGGYARRRFVRRTGHEPKNRYGETLFAVTVAALMRWVASRRDDSQLVSVFPRYHPWWAHWTARVPLVREIATWNVVVVLRKR